jgi:hypothetical protein
MPLVFSANVFAETRREERQMKKIENLRWNPMWVSHLGCIKGCLEYLNLDVSEGWLFGATGHAFILNVAEDVSPAGPTAWNTEMLFRLGRNVGYTVEGVQGRESQPDFAERRKRAWENTNKAIDEGLPCYGWELGPVREYYVVYGYDDKGYYHSGAGSEEKEAWVSGIDGKFRSDLDKGILSEEFRQALEKKGVVLSRNVLVKRRVERTWVITDQENQRKYGFMEMSGGGGGLGILDLHKVGAGPKLWQELGANGWLEMYFVKRGKAADDRRTVKETFEFVLEHAKSPERWIFSGFKAGLDGFDAWIQALETGQANGFGVAYNAAVWLECRRFAVEFLKEAKERIGGKLRPTFDEAAGRYEVAAQNLEKVAEAFPFHARKPEHITDGERRKTAVAHLKNARKAEASGLRAVEKILSEL